MPLPPHMVSSNFLFLIDPQRGIGARSSSIPHDVKKDDSTQVVVKGRFRIREVLRGTGFFTPTTTTAAAVGASSSFACASGSASSVTSVVASASTRTAAPLTIDTKPKTDNVAKTTVAGTALRQSSYGSSIQSADTFISPTGSPRVSMLLFRLT